jgi:cobalt/nickel transport system permease protein
MHVPDGYLSPATCGVLYATATPFWAIGLARVRRSMGGRSVPLLAVFAALIFAVMMFNIPVPGGTTAHATGAVLAAIVIGPWAAVIAASVALVIQAVFFADGGILAIGANVVNIGVLLPLAGYAVYRLVAGRSSVLSERRVVAAAIGGYAGITLAALAVGVELGIQPGLHNTNGVPDYSPYGLSTAIPSMLVAHLLGASFVEGAVTALGLAYLQRSYPEMLLRTQRAPARAALQRRSRAWLLAAAVVPACLAAVFVGGLLEGGSLREWGGLDWTSVNWSAAGGAVLVSAAASALVLPLVALMLRGRKAWRGPALIFVAFVLWAPLGLIAPGGAFGEDESASTAEVAVALEARANGDSSLFDALPDVNRECSCVPAGMAGTPRAPALAGYQPPWVSEDDPPWKQDLGYQFAGLTGIAALVALAFALRGLARWLVPAPEADWRTAEE